MAQSEDLAMLISGVYWKSQFKLVWKGLKNERKKLRVLESDVACCYDPIAGLPYCGSPKDRWRKNATEML
jgi:hypothetical protein